MASESALWSNMKKQGRNIPALAMQRHEDRYSTGIPDVSYSCMGVNGWIELKEIHHWPKRPETTLKIKHYTQDQRDWLLRHGRAGGRCWLLLQVERDYLLFDYNHAQQVGFLTKEELFHRCTQYWQKTLPLLQLMSVIV